MVWFAPKLANALLLDRFSAVPVGSALATLVITSALVTVVGPVYVELAPRAMIGVTGPTMPLKVIPAVDAMGTSTSKSVPVELLLKLVTEMVGLAPTNCSDP